MKTKRKLKMYGLIAIITISSSLFTVSCTDDETSIDSLSEQEKNMLLQMREEEKLARDVYDYLYEAYSLQIFDNISNSEQKHMDKVLTLLNKYSIEDPALPNPGEFSNETLQTLYNQLTTQGAISEEEALKVGATIEDLDIYDLEEFSAVTDNTDILDVFEKLTCGSRNHMRGFYGQIINGESTYEAQYITQTELDEIINNSHEQCGH